MSASVCLFPTYEDVVIFNLVSLYYSRFAFPVIVMIATHQLLVQSAGEILYVCLYRTHNNDNNIQI